jgi:serine/threonine-protein kinase
LVRAYALLGNLERVKAGLDEMPIHAPSNAGELITRARLSIWFPELLEQIKTVQIPADASPTSPWSVVMFARDVANGIPVDEHFRLFKEYLQRMHRSTRFTCIVRQLMTEFLTYFGRFDEALEQIEAAVRDGLFDLTWADRCPVLVKLRADPRFAPSHAVIADRAQSVRNALGV